ncbi:MAG: exopolyphosphatase [Flavobacteriaceae bacterium]|nr:exopolyphosphatase [Flavobacteriaceae bacterium]
MKILKYAAIDIGSNGVRLLISNVVVFKKKEAQFKKSSLVRVPIRLGEDVFTTGVISENNKNRMCDVMQAFQLLMKVYGVEKYKACATSAMREAKNSKEIVASVFESSGVKIDIINGKTEAEIISSTDLSQLIQSDKSYLYVDVGGGSTEFTFFSDGKLINSKSFPLGTVRLLDNKVDENIWNDVKKWVKENSKGLLKLSMIGSGGNINKIFKMSGKMEGKPLSYIYLNSYFNFLNQMTYNERISELDLNPDRADVIIPASQIYLRAMKWSNAKKIYVPKIGLSDGIIKSLYMGKFDSSN